MDATNVLHPSYSNRLYRQWHSSDLKLGPENFIYPIFLSDDPDCDEIITSLVDQKKVGINKLAALMDPLVAKGLQCILLFGSVKQNKKDAIGSAADGNNSVVIPAIRFLKNRYTSLIVACDVCLCGYTDHGHCGIIHSDGTINNQQSISRLAAIAASFAMAGADMIAPSDMMDGRVKAIKRALQTSEIHRNVSIMSYSAKFASSFYGPFRDAVNSAPAFGDRRCYQLPPGARGLAIRAAQRDADEGAQFIMVKPGLPYLDIVRDLKEILPHHPLAVYHVSGEYVMLRRAAETGAVNLKQAALEIMTSFRRAGASIIITYLTPYLLDLDLSEACN